MVVALPPRWLICFQISMAAVVARHQPISCPRPALSPARAPCCQHVCCIAKIPRSCAIVVQCDQGGTDGAHGLSGRRRKEGCAVVVTSVPA